MSVIKELIRTEEDGTISFGNSENQNYLILNMMVTCIK